MVVSGARSRLAWAIIWEPFHGITSLQIPHDAAFGRLRAGRARASIGPAVACDRIARRNDGTPATLRTSSAGGAGSMNDASRRDHWQNVYPSKGQTQRSWFQETPA